MADNAKDNRTEFAENAQTEVKKEKKVQKDKVKACKTPNEILELAKNEGIELDEEQLEQISGGDWGVDSRYITCDECHSNVTVTEQDFAKHYVVCPKCNSVYNI